MSHIALVAPSLDRIGGAEQQLILLAKGLLRRGWRVSVVVLSGSGKDAARELIAAGAAFLTLEMRKGLADPRGWLRFHRWLKENSPDLIHAHLSHGVWMARWSRLAAPVRVVLDTLHSTSTGSLGRRLGYRGSDWLSDRVTAVSQAVADAHLSAAMVDARKLIVVPNGVDVETWKSDASIRTAVRRELGLEDEFLWIAVGRLEPVKDYLTLLRAFGHLTESARLAIAGMGPLQDELLQLSRQLGFEKRVHFLGFQTDVLRWLQAADAFVLCSLWEGLPISLLEAAACALPAVATDIPGIRQVLVDGKSGFLAPVGDPETLATKMRALMQSPLQESAAMGLLARKLVVERFSLEAILDRWEAEYRDLLARNPQPGRWAFRV